MARPGNNADPIDPGLIVKPFLLWILATALAAPVQAKPPVPALKGLTPGMSSAQVLKLFPAAECSDRICVIELAEGYTLAQQAASRAMIGLYRGGAIAISFELPQGSWEDLCGALRAHPAHSGWRYKTDDSAGACTLTAPDRRWRFEVSSAADGSLLGVTLLDAKQFAANQADLDRERAKDL